MRSSAIIPLLAIALLAVWRPASLVSVGAEVPGDPQSDVIYHSNRPWPAQLHRLLELPVGRTDYLPAYDNLMKFLFGPGGIWPHRDKVPDSSAALRFVLRNPRSKRDFSAVLDDITSKGVPALLLRNRILRTLTLSGAAMASARADWRYFTVRHRMVLAYMYEHRAAQLARAGHRVQAADCVKAFLFLWSQEDAAFSPLGWLSSQPVPMEHMGIAPTVARKFPPLFRAELAAFKVRQVPALELASLASKNLKPARAIRPTFSARFVGLFKAAFLLQSGHLSQQYALLQSLRDYRRGLALAGHRETLRQISATLRAWLKASIAKLSISGVERHALWRWAQEALL